MARKGENIYKRKDGRWEGRYIRDRSPAGKAVYGYVYAHTYKEAKHKLAACTAFADQGLRQKTDAQNIRFGRLAAAWSNSIAPNVKASTLVKYLHMLDDHILPVLQDLHCADITYQVLEEFSNQLLTQGGKAQSGLSPKTVTDVLSVVKLVLKYGANHGFCVPYTGYGIYVRQHTSELKLLTQAEQQRLLNKLLAEMNCRNFGLLLCLFTGIRIGELCALQWKDISVQEKTVHIHRSMQRIPVRAAADRKTEVIITTPKSQCSIRIIPLPDAICNIIQEQFSEASGYVLTGDPCKYTEPRVMQYYFKKVLRDCGIPETNFHTLRHTFATRGIECGFDVKSLSEILGHASVSITMNRYVHPSMTLKRENMNLLSDAIAVR